MDKFQFDLYSTVKSWLFCCEHSSFAFSLFSVKCVMCTQFPLNKGRNNFLGLCSSLLGSNYNLPGTYFIRTHQIYFPVVLLHTTYINIFLLIYLFLRKANNGELHVSKSIIYLSKGPTRKFVYIFITWVFYLWWWPLNVIDVWNQLFDVQNAWVWTYIQKKQLTLIMDNSQRRKTF